MRIMCIAVVGGGDVDVVGGKTLRKLSKDQGQLGEGFEEGKGCGAKPSL